jgi:hypothetical protein
VTASEADDAARNAAARARLEPQRERLTPTQRERLTPTQRLHEVTMAALTRAPAPPEHTVALTLNAKGDVQIEVTGRGHDLGALTADVLGTFEALRAKYPRGNGGA